jgi:hypothetical protein
MLPLSKNKLKIVKKIRKQYSHVYFHILGAHTQFCEELTFFMRCAKNIKKVSKRLILVPFLSSYVDYTEGRFFLRRLRST